MSDTVTMWSALPATTRGKVEEVAGRVSGNYLSWGSSGFSRIGKDVFATKEEAEKRARVMVSERIASLEKTLARVRKNPFAADPA